MNDRGKELSLLTTTTTATNSGNSLTIPNVQCRYEKIGLTVQSGGS